VAGIPWRDDDDFVAEVAQHIRDPDDHCRDAVDLRRISVCYERNSHEPTLRVGGQQSVTYALRLCNGG